MASVSKNRNGRPGFIISYYALNGTRKRKIVHCSRREAEMIAQEIEAKKSRIRLGFEKEFQENILLMDAKKYYHQHTERSPKTINREEKVFKVLDEYLGTVRIRQVNSAMISSYFKKRKSSDKLADATLGLEFRTLRAFFNYMVRHNFLEESPMSKMKHPTVRDKKIRFLSEDEIYRLLGKIDDQNYTDLVLMYLYTGARREEILKDKFTWDNVDFIERNITIIGKGNKLRVVPINDLVYEILYRRRNIEHRTVPFEHNYEYLFKKIAKYYQAANIKNANVHTLRKTFGSILVQKGVDIFTVSKLMGHSSVRVTEKHYAELLDKNLRDGVDKLNFN
jgi:site-specific recombinase XerD